MVNAWASLKSFVPKEPSPDAGAVPPGPDDAGGLQLTKEAQTTEPSQSPTPAPAPDTAAAPAPTTSVMEKTI